MGGATLQESTAIKLGLKKMRTYIHVYIQQCMYIYMYITLHNLYVVHVYPQHTIPELVHVFFIIPPLPPSSTVKAGC